MTLLYIDPGTGSMLFSIFIGACATLYFLLKAFIIKIRTFFAGGKDATKDKSYKDYVIYSEDKRYFTVFLPVLQEFERRKIEVYYYTAKADDPVFAEHFKYIKPEVIGEGNKAYAKLNLLNAGIVLMSTPGLDVYQLKRSKNVKHYSHIFHSTSDAAMYRLFGLDFFDSILMTGDYQAENIRFLEQKRHLPPKDLITVGCTYLDYMKNKIGSIQEDKNHNFTVLVSPSWGPSGLLSLFGEKLLDPLVDSGFDIIIRPHPQSKISETEILNRIINRYKDKKNVTFDNERDNIYSMKKADIMISDFSGIIYDYLFLCDKPVMYAESNMNLEIYDAWYIEKKLWQFQVVEDCGIKIEEKDFPNIKEIIKNASDSPELAAAREKARNEGWQYIGNAGKRTVDYLENIMKTISM